MAREIFIPKAWSGRNPELRHLRYEVTDDLFLQIFGDYARLIRRSEKACEEAARHGNPDYADFVGESETYYIEELIGGSFLL